MFQFVLAGYPVAAVQKLYLLFNFHPRQVPVIDAKFSVVIQAFVPRGQLLILLTALFVLFPDPIVRRHAMATPCCKRLLCAGDRVA